MLKYKLLASKKALILPGKYSDNLKAGVRKFTNTYLPKVGDETVEDLLETLVAFPTITNDVAANSGAVKYVGRFLRSLGMHVEYHEWGGHPALWATTQTHQKHPRLLLAAHIDVVSAPKAMFHLKKNDGKLHGRGVMDMKGALAAYMRTASELQGQLGHYDFGIMITSDEETAGSTSGVSHFIHNGYAADFVVLPDGGREWNFERSAKGLIHLTLEAHGKSAHASRPWLGENAVDKLAVVLNELRNQFKNQGPETNTLNIGVIQGGEVYNQIPSFVTAEIDIRVIDEESSIRLVKFIEELSAKHKIKAIFQGTFMPVQHSLENPHIKAFMDVVEEVRGIRPEGVTSYGGSDARFFRQNDIPVAVFYPTGGGHHSDNEWIEAKALEQMEKIFVRSIRTFGRVKDNYKL